METRKLYIDRMKVRTFMRKRGYRYFRDLAAAMGVHHLSLLRRVTRHNVGYFRNDFVERMAEVLDCNPIDLLSTTGFPQPSLPPQPVSPWPPPNVSMRIDTGSGRAPKPRVLPQNEEASGEQQ